MQLQNAVQIALNQQNWRLSESKSNPLLSDYDFNTNTYDSSMCVTARHRWQAPYVCFPFHVRLVELYPSRWRGAFPYVSSNVHGSSNTNEQSQTPVFVCPASFVTALPTRAPLWPITITPWLFKRPFRAFEEAVIVDWNKRGR